MRAIGAALGLAALVAFAGDASASHDRRPCPTDARLGAVAYLRGTSLHLLDLSTCGDRVLVRRGASPPVEFIRGGRSIRYGRNSAVPVAGGRPVRVAAESGLRSPDGRLVARIRARRRPGAKTGTQSIVVGGRAIYTLRESYRRAPAGAPGPLALVAWSADSRWLLFYVDPMGSASIVADGIRLRAIRATGGQARKLVVTLGYPDYLAWCGRRLVATAGASRLATENKWLVLASPPAWRARKLVRGPARAWGSIACTADGARLAAQSQPASHNPSFFSTRWSLWSVRLDGSRRRLTAPPRGYADESPRWSRDGRALLFVRSRRGAGRLYLWRSGTVLGPLANLGSSLGYYGHQDWWARADWWQPRP